MNPMAVTYPHAAKEIDRMFPHLPNEPRPWREGWADTNTPEGLQLDDMNWQMEMCAGCRGMADCTHENAPQGDSTLDVGVRQVWQPRHVAMMTKGRAIDPDFWEVSPDGSHARRTILVGHGSPCRYAKAQTDYNREEQTAVKSHIPTVYRSASLNNFEIVQGSQHIVVAAQNYISEKQYMDGRWLFLGGSVGAGKTHIASAIANAARDAGHRVAYMKAADVLGQAQTEGNEFGKAAWDMAAAADLAIIDDIGREFLGKGDDSWQSRRMDQLIDTIYTNNRGLIVTANLHTKEFDKMVKDDYSDRAYSRMNERTTKFYMEFPDYRAKIGAKA